MTRTAHFLWRSNSATTTAEFALVLPLFLILLFGVIDAGRFLYEYNEAEKATQVGARVAIVTNVLSPELRDKNYVGESVGGQTIAAGDRIPAAALGTLTCTVTGCTCPVPPCPSGGTVDSATFNDVLVARMQQIYPVIQAENVEVSYSGSGLGVAADPTGGTGVGNQMQISPLITVTLKDMSFQPITSLLLASIPMPDFSTTLSAEDASGQFSN